MKRLNSIETDQVQFEVIECDCGMHFGIDATFIDQVGHYSFKCPACGKRIYTAWLDDDGELGKEE